MYKQYTGSRKKRGKYRIKGKILRGGLQLREKRRRRKKKKKATFMNPQVWNPTEGLPPIPRGANFYIIQAPIEGS